MDDTKLALLGNKDAAKRLTEAGVHTYPYKDGSWQRNPKLYSLWNTIENSRNTRKSKFLTINGEKKTVSEWCEIYDVSPYTVYWWIREKGCKYAEERVQRKNTRAPILSAEEMEMLDGKD